MDVSTATPSRRNRWILSLGYGAGSFGANVTIFPATSLILYFLTDTIGLSVALATLVISLPKIWDMIVDPAIGALADRYARTRGNRFSVFLIVSLGLPVGASSVFLLPVMSPLFFALLAVALLIVKSTFYTVFLVSHVAAADDIGRSGLAPRNAMLAVRIVGQASGALVAGAATPLLLSLNPDPHQGYRLVAAILAASGTAGLLVCALALRPMPTEVSETGRGRLNMLVAMRNAASRPLALGLIVSNFGVMIAASYLANVLPFVNKYVLRAGDLALSPMFTSLMIFMLAGAALGPVLAARLGNVRALRFAALWLIAAASLFFPAAGTLWAMVPVLALWGLGMGAYTVLLQSSLLDAAKGGAVSSGIVGLLLGLLFATGKIGDTLGGVIAGATLAGSGGGPAMAADMSAAYFLRLAFGVVPALLVATGLGIMLQIEKGRAARSPFDGHLE